MKPAPSCSTTLAELIRARERTDKQEERLHRNVDRPARVGDRRLQPVGPAHGGDVRAEPTRSRERGDLADQVLAHARLQAPSADHERDVAGEASQVDGSLARGVAATHDRHVAIPEGERPVIAAP